MRGVDCAHSTDGALNPQHDRSATAKALSCKQKLERQRTWEMDISRSISRRVVSAPAQRFSHANVDGHDGCVIAWGARMPSGVAGDRAVVRSARTRQRRYRLRAASLTFSPASFSLDLL